MRARRCLYNGLAALYRFITWQRNLFYDRGLIAARRIGLPVISVGNITVGGNAKTPLCIYLVSELSRKGFCPAVLSRGYGGSLTGPHLVSLDDSAECVGDEPLLIARRTGRPVVVSRDRVKGAQLIERQALADLIILDDGFQHRRLYRDVNIMMVDVSSEAAVREFTEGSLLPAGRLREDLKTALKRVDLMILASRGPMQDGHNREELISLLPRGLPLFQSCIKPDLPRRIDQGQVLRPPATVAAFCGIAKPTGFFATLKELGFNLIGEQPFPDHYRFVNADIERLRDQYPAAALVCTEKDAVKLAPLAAATQVYYLAISSTVEPAEVFIEQVLSLAKPATFVCGAAT